MNSTIRSWIAALAAVAIGVSSLGAAGGGEAAAARAASPADAAFYPEQWNLKAIRAKAGWPVEPLPATPDDEVLVAIVDTGIDFTHPDIGIRRNPDGTPGNGGLVDLEKSTSLIEEVAPNTPCELEPGVREPGTAYRANRSRDPLDELAEAAKYSSSLVMDFHSHGTGVSGLIASNAEWLAGVTQHTTLFSVKVHGMGRQNCLSVYLEGIEYAAEQGADVIHLSIPLEFDQLLWPGAVERVNASLAYAHALGSILVTPAGNAMPGLPPSDLDEGTMFRFCEGDYVVCVGATGTTSADLVAEPYWDQIAAYSNYGSPIDVVGPGGTTAVPVRLTCSTHTEFQGAPQAPCRAGEKTWFSTGTSFGGAATSGLAALLSALVPDATPDEVEKLIKDSAVELGEPGDDDYYGEGRIDVKRAVRLVLE
jgi:subtilisin family serine protease